MRQYLVPLLTTERCPFLALETSSSEPDVKSIIPSFPWHTVNVMLFKYKKKEIRNPNISLISYIHSHEVHRHDADLSWLMLMLLSLSAQIATLVNVSITWSLCSTASPYEQYISLYIHFIHQQVCCNNPSLIIF